MPVTVHDPDAVEQWLATRINHTQPLDLHAPFQMATWCNAYVNENEQVTELVRPEGSFDSNPEGWDEFRDAQAQPMLVALSCAGTSVLNTPRPCVVVVHGMQHTFLLEPPNGSLMREALATVKRTLDGDGSAEVVQRYRVSGVERGPDNHRVKDWFIQVKVDSITAVRSLCRKLPRFKSHHTERPGSYELPASTVELARAGLRPSVCFKVANAQLDDDGLVHAHVRDIKVVDDGPSLITMGWDLETTGLSMQYSSIGVVSCAFWVQGSILGALTIAVAKDTYGLMEQVPVVFPGGVPDSHCLYIAPTERDAVSFFVSKVLCIANTTWGYNSYKFDMPMLVARVRHLALVPQLVHWLPGGCARVEEKVMESSAVGSNMFMLLNTGQIHSDLLLDAWKHNFFQPGSQSLNHVLKTVCGISKRAQAYAVIRELIEHPTRRPRDTMEMWLYGAQDSLVLFALSQPVTTAQQVLEPMGIDQTELRRILQVHTHDNVRDFVPDMPADANVDQYCQQHGIEVEIGETEGFVDGWLVLPDGTRIRQDGDQDVWTSPRNGLGDSVMPIAKLCMMHPEKVLSYGQQLRMRSVIYTMGVLGDYVFDFSRSTAAVASYEGGDVETLRSGVYGEGVYADFSAMYPTIMINFVLSMECPQGVTEAQLDDDPEWVDALRNECIIPQCVKQLLSLRRALEAEMKGATPTKVKMLKNAVRSVKGTINSIYGFFGSPTNSFGTQFAAIASMTTFIGRREINYVKDTAERLSFDQMCADEHLGPIVKQHGVPEFVMRVCYGDTDSKVILFVKPDGQTAAGLPLDFVSEFSDALCAHINRLSRWLGIGTITGILDVEILFSRIMGCSQSKTYAAVVQTRKPDGSWKASFRLKGFAMVRSDRLPFVKEQQRLCMDAVLTRSPAEARTFILHSTHTAMRILSEAGGSSLCGMSEQAADLLPFVQAKVCNKMGDKTPQSIVASWLNRNGDNVALGQKVAFCITQGSGKVWERAIPVSRALSKRNPSGLPHDVDNVKHSLLEANSRTLAAAMGIPPSQALDVLKNYQPGQQSITGGEVAPLRQPDMKADLGKKRGQGKVLEIAAKSCKKITVFMDSQEPLGRAKRRRTAHSNKKNEQQQAVKVDGDIKSFFK